MANNQNMINNLLNVKNNEELVNKLTVLQNEIGVSFNTKVVAVTSIKRDELANAFAKAFAETYAVNGASVLIIDANMYNPCLVKTLNNDGSDDADIEVKSKKEEYRIQVIDDKARAICLPKEIYPSEVFKSGLIHNIIRDNYDKYDHFVVLVPSIKEHKEVSLLGDILESIILITQRSLTKKEDIYNAIQYFAVNKLPLAKTVILK